MREICGYVQICALQPGDVYLNKKVLFMVTFDFKKYSLLTLKNTNEKY